MEVRKGYKQTEVGIIPEDWQIIIGESLTTLIGKGASPRWQGYSYCDWGMLFITSENVRDGFLDVPHPKYLPFEFHERIKRTKLQRYDLLINLVGASIGRSCQILNDLGQANVNQAVAVFRVRDEYSARYISYVLQAQSTICRILEMQVDAARQNISLANLRGFPIPLPPTKAEQEAIAGALSDADAWIESLEQLIAKKRQIKQGAMQELLTGKTRLPGFTGKWAVKPFSSVLTRINSKCHQIQTHEYQTTGIYPVVDQGKKAIAGFSDKIDKRFRCPAEGVIIFGDHTCTVKFIDVDFLVGADGTQILVAKEGQCTRFHSLQLEYRGIEPTGYNRHFKLLKERDFLTPPFQEQSVIAAVLSDIDAEIESLEGKQTKARQIKQGMMQELLTGRIRLV
jgi:type I restriction enzyme S subunit